MMATPPPVAQLLLGAGALWRRTEVSVFGTGESVVLAQGAAFVVGAEQAALLQDGHDVIHEMLERARQHRRHDVEAVRRAVLPPMLDGVGHLLWRARERAVPAPAAQAPDQLAHGEAIAPRQVHDQREAALAAFDRVFVRNVAR